VNGCLLRVVTEESAIGEITCNELNNKEDRNSCYRWTAQRKRDIKICIDNAEAETEVLIYNDICFSAIRDLNNDIYNILKNPQHPDIMYAIKSVKYSLGVCHGEEKQVIPSLKEIVRRGLLESKKEALNTLIDNAYCLGGNTFEGEKEFLRKEVLPLIINQPELKNYVDNINKILDSKVIPPVEITPNINNSAPIL
jgi:hypothetical protein